MKRWEIPSKSRHFDEIILIHFYCCVFFHISLTTFFSFVKNCIVDTNENLRFSDGRLGPGELGRIAQVAARELLFGPCFDIRELLHCVQFMSFIAVSLEVNIICDLWFNFRPSFFTRLDCWKIRHVNYDFISGTSSVENGRSGVFEILNADSRRELRIVHFFSTQRHSHWLATFPFNTFPARRSWLGSHPLPI